MSSLGLYSHFSKDFILEVLAIFFDAYYIKLAVKGKRQAECRIA